MLIVVDGPYIMSTHIICRIKRQLKLHAEMFHVFNFISVERKMLNQNVNNVKTFTVTSPFPHV